jgi:hypothetical protein
MDLLQKIDMFIGEESSIEKKVKQHNIAVKYGKKGTLNRPPKGYVKDNKGMYHKVSDDEWKKKRLGEGKDFPAKKKSDDKDSDEIASDNENGKSTLEKAKDEEEDTGSMSPEEIKAKEKKQKELKKKADKEAKFTPAYSAT